MDALNVDHEGHFYFYQVKTMDALVTIGSATSCSRAMFDT